MKREGRTLVSRSSISEFRRCTKRNPEKKAGKKKKSSGRSVGRSVPESLGGLFLTLLFLGGGEAASNASAKGRCEKWEEGRKKECVSLFLF